TTGGKVKATSGELSATTQARFFAPLPWSFDFEQGPVPRWWISAGPRFKITDLAGKRLHKPPQEAGLQGRRVGDIGLIDQGYTLDVMGKKHELQLRTWAAELEKSTTVPFTAEP